MPRIYSRDAEYEAARKLRERQRAKLAHAPALVACSHLGLSYHQLRQLAEAGKIRAARGGDGQIFYDVTSWTPLNGGQGLV